MRIHAVAAIVLVSGLMVAADAPRDAGKEELGKLQGTWVAVSGERNGAPVPDAAIKSWKMVVQGNKMTINPQTDNVPLAFELDLSKTPKQIVLTLLEPRRKGQTRRGIYSLENDLFKICCDNDDKKPNVKPPTGFSTRQGDGLLMFVAKRQKP
jgi:uncharacterized protein (TIGR03067 family)